MGISAFERHYRVLAAAVLLIAALNLGVRLGREVVTDWDEALFANNAAEMVQSGDWIATTNLGQLDYYNAKPPLNVWLIAASFKAFGLNLLSLRLTSVVSAWLTVLFLMIWSRRCFGPAVSLIAGAVLATNFGFVHVHAGRSADTDALLTLLILLTVIILWAAEQRRWRLVLLGPVMAAVFLLKGMTVLLPLAIVAAAELGRRLRPDGDRSQLRWRPLVAALPLFVVPVAIWAGLRWQVDGWKFLETVAVTDFVGHAFSVLEGHRGSPLFYLDVIQKHEYLWLIAAVVALVLAPLSRIPFCAWLVKVRTLPAHVSLLAIWIAITLAVPTIMGTKLPWYINPFYPAFAVVVGILLARGLTDSVTTGRKVAMGLVIGLAFLASESKLAWYSMNYRDLNRSSQGMLLAQTTELKDRNVYSFRWDSAERFVVRGLVGAATELAADPEDFLRRSAPGDFLFWNCEVPHPELTLVKSNGRHWLYRRDRMIGALIR